MSQEEHCQVVALFCTVGKDADVLFQEVDDLNSRGLAVLLHIVQHAVLAKEFPAAVVREVHGLRQSVGIEQQSTAWWEVHLLFIVIIVILHADGQIGLHLQQTAFALGGNHHGGIVGSIAIGQVVGLHVEHAHKHSDKDIRVVGGGDGVVHLADDVGSTLVVACKVSEQCSCHGHIERCRHALSCHVADDKEELVALDDKVVEVAAHLLGRGHRRKEVEVLSLRERGGDHTHLDVVGNLQLTLQAFLTGGGGLQVADVLLQGMQHVGEGITQLEQLVLGAYLR